MTEAATPEETLAAEEKAAVKKLARYIWNELNPTEESAEGDKDARKAAWSEAKGGMFKAVNKGVRRMGKDGWALSKAE